VCALSRRAPLGPGTRRYRTRPDTCSPWTCGPPTRGRPRLRATSPAPAGTGGSEARARSPTPPALPLGHVVPGMSTPRRVFARNSIFGGLSVYKSVGSPKSASILKVGKGLYGVPASRSDGRRNPVRSTVSRTRALRDVRLCQQGRRVPPVRLSKGPREARRPMRPLQMFRRSRPVPPGATGPAP